MLRVMRLRKGTDPKTATHSFRAPAQSECTWTCHNSHSVRKKNAADQEQAKLPAPSLRESGQSKRTWTYHKSHHRKFAGKMPGPRGSTLIDHQPYYFVL